MHDLPERELGVLHAEGAHGGASVLLLLLRPSGAGRRAACSCPQRVQVPHVALALAHALAEVQHVLVARGSQVRVHDRVVGVAAVQPPALAAPRVERDLLLEGVGLDLFFFFVAFYAVVVVLVV